MMIFTASNKQPILKFLYSIDPNVFWEKEFNEGKIRVGRYFVGCHYILSVGNKVIHDPDLELPEPKVNFRYRLIYEDKYLAVIDKPVPLPIHPTGSYFHHTLTRLLRREGKPWYVVHRLDNETSGILLLAKKSEYVKKLNYSLAAGKKVYIVMVHGLTPLKFTVNIPLGKKLGSRVFKRQGYNLQGKNSSTYFRRIAYQRGQDQKIQSLLFAQPLTGRTHQIRAHLAESQFPVVGDKIYGKDEGFFLRYLKNLEEIKDRQLINDLELERQFLHCRSITITHPFTMEMMRVKSDLPHELKNYLESLTIENLKI